MKEWYCAISGQTKGPFQEAELRKMAAQGVLTSDTLVWNGDPGNAERGWVRAAETEVAAILNGSGGAVPSFPYAYAPPPPAAPDPRIGPGFELAPRWRRLLAVFCDSLTVFVPIFAAIFLSGLTAAIVPGIVGSTMAADLISMLPVLIIMLALLVLLGINLRFLYRDGQTIGKKILRVRIANRDGGRARLISIIFLRIVPFWILSVIVNAAAKANESIYFSHDPVLQAMSAAGALILLADTLFIFRKDRRTLHDMLAGTIVIMR